MKRIGLAAGLMAVALGAQAHHGFGGKWLIVATSCAQSAMETDHDE